MAGRRCLISPPEAEEVDHRHLPDVIIHHIFSFLPFKDVVKTSVLSNQWRFAWTSTPNRSLSPLRGCPPSISGALSLCTATTVEKFHLDASMSDLCTRTELDRWFRFTAVRKVEDASLVFGRRWHHDVPRILCGCASLVSLRVSNCTFSSYVTIHWPSLKKLCIHDVFLDSDGIMKILSGCPVVESLKLHVHCNLRMNSISLRELVIEAVYISSLHISTPNLLSLRLSGGFDYISFRPSGVSSLAEAELNFDKPTEFGRRFADHLKFLPSPDRLKFLLEELQHVAKITIGSWCLEVRVDFVWSFFLFDGPVPIHFALKALYLKAENLVVRELVFISIVASCSFHAHASTYMYAFAVNLISSTFGLFTFDNKDYPELYDFDEKQFWHSQKGFYCVANHLKRVEIVGFEFDNEK
ncbi:F-box protein At5g03100-like [Syzygium oleosum]|uniref:F-box protein At5g03100-like n=1 Tax=Syzygium oleosum TaxID=219896 RepID=UPI0024B8B6F4|nr:F-box protein At5g03100-like [Syzygium oleosum]